MVEDEASPSKGARTRQALVDAAVHRFATDGYRGTTLTAVAGDVGISPAAVYRHFADKDELFLAAVNADAEGLVGLARDALGVDTGGSLLELLGQLSDGVAVAAADHPLVARVLAGLDVLSPQRILELPALAELRAELVELLRFGQAAGLVRADLDPAPTVLALETVVLDHVAYLVTIGGPAPGPDERWAAVVHLLDAALRPPV